ncbi:hypothetical protein B4U80_13817 [Leptotrombidium deliense]|uniref:Chitin-binding type-2 domain-containing protein n=1 Tax=Leptotrombidium deliense TaxID=299467 RepID=A0A443SCT6_9ACAR|nr:hypothetical protein B4U80_13817 [Leptotrombidium deliense]
MTAVRPVAKNMPLPNKNICKGANMYYRDPVNCTCFYHCDTSYRPHYKCCLPGQFFSELISNCDWSDGGLDCLQEHRISELEARSYREENQCPETNAAFANENDCKTFWDCNGPRPVLTSCLHITKFTGTVHKNVCDCDSLRILNKIQDIRKKQNN